MVAGTLLFSGVRVRGRVRPLPGSLLPAGRLFQGRLGSALHGRAGPLHLPVPLPHHPGPERDRAAHQRARRPARPHAGHGRAQRRPAGRARAGRAARAPAGPPRPAGLAVRGGPDHHDRDRRPPAQRAADVRPHPDPGGPGPAPRRARSDRRINRTISPGGTTLMSAPAGPPDTGSDKLDRRVLKVAGVVVLGAIMSILDITVVSIALPTFQSEFNATYATVAWTMTAYTLALPTVIPITGWA